MKIKFLHAFAVLLFFGIISCSSEPKVPTNASVELKSDLQPLYDEVMTVHDEMMPKLNDITKHQTTLRNRLDTLRTQPELKQELMRTNSILGDLNRAEDAMWTWMHGFGALDTIPQHKQEQWLRQERADVESMKNLMLSSITKAEEFTR